MGKAVRMLTAFLYHRFLGFFPGVAQRVFLLFCPKIFDVIIRNSPIVTSISEAYREVVRMILDTKFCKFLLELTIRKSRIHFKQRFNIFPFIAQTRHFILSAKFSSLRHPVVEQIFPRNMNHRHFQRHIVIAFCFIIGINQFQRIIKNSAELFHIIGLFSEFKNPLMRSGFSVFHINRSSGEVSN